MSPLLTVAMVSLVSAEAAVAATSDAAYVAWLDAANAPSPWPTDATVAQTAASLNAVLTYYGVNTSAASA
ncbi:hypothetical protein B4Q13_22920 [Lacticaseibacillus rhamnosus]